MPRLFTALEIPSPIALRISMLQAGLSGARWIDRENLHITLRFIGDVDLPLARELVRALERVKTHPFNLRLEGLDVFGGKKPRSLYAGAVRDDALVALQSEHERICQNIGLDAEGRRFKPHVTLARIRNVSLPDIARYLSANGGFSSEAFPVGRFVLMSSRDSVGGGPYVIEESYQLVEKEDPNGRPLYT